MQKFKVVDMACGHCASVVENSIKRIDPNAQVSAYIDRREITVRSEADNAQIAEAIRSTGYNLLGRSAPSDRETTVLFDI
ncbi:heavy-metal-associated domain-containing protein [Marinicauda pacifica]|uniref:heavy-metal-associated domain-containing protein n=1 Tax=Marinicauda pacifica TaxID=1133559 RepID=UPI0035C8741A